jgi:hypothetical protein
VLRVIVRVARMPVGVRVTVPMRVAVTVMDVVVSHASAHGI